MTVPQIKNLFLEFELFTNTECTKIISLISNLENTLYTIKLNGEFYEKGCSLKSTNLIDNENTQWIYNRVKSKVSSMLNVDWIGNPHGVFRKYSPGDYFLEHKDNVDSIDSDERYFTVVVQLTMGDKYTGGNVIINRNTYLNRVIGTAALWGSNVTHSVTPLLSGSRISLAFFVSSKHVNIRSNVLI